MPVVANPNINAGSSAARLGSYQASLYGNDWATIHDDGTVELDLSGVKITGPIVPVVRVLRRWIDGPLGNAVEKTWTRAELQALAARLKVVGEQVENVLRITVDTALGPSKVLQVVGRVTVTGLLTYALIVPITQLNTALARIEAV